MSRDDPACRAFWDAYAGASGIGHDEYETLPMADGEAPLADELVGLILDGRKRATAMLLRDHTVKGEALPVLGGHVVVLDSAGRPRAIWRTTEVRIGPLNSVDDTFAWDEGEGDRTRADWLAGHGRWFRRQAGREGFVFHDEIETVFERFEVVWPPEAADRPPRA
jgi:uncharacterized protein YhfF